jgi:DNA-binding transcriptional LysR family regulator
MREINDLKKIRHVVGVAKAGSFTAASGVLALTQSALTKSVAEVESQLGLRLFERTSRGIRLTAAGESFLPRAERLLAEAADLLLDFRDVQMLAAGNLRIGVGPSAFMTFLETSVSAFARVYPAIGITVEDGSEDRIVQALRQGEIDLVVGGCRHLEAWREIQTHRIAPLHLFFIARRDHPLGQGTVTAKALLSYPIVMPSAGLGVDQELREAYLQAGLAPVPPRYRCDQIGMVMGLVEATDAISPILSLAAPGTRFQEKYLVFEDAVQLAPLELGVGVPAGRDLSPAASAFLDLFRGFLSEASVSV